MKKIAAKEFKELYATSFYFDDLTDLRRYDGRFDSLIKSDDKDIILCCGLIYYHYYMSNVYIHFLQPY